MNSIKHYVIYSHGFGVTKTDRGLFTDISGSMPDMKHILFDYNKIDAENNTLTVTSLQDQVALFREHLSNIEEDATVDVIAHSQGCLVAALARPERVGKTLFLAPPASVDVDQLISFFGDRPNSKIDVSGVSQVSRRDGSTTIIPAAYWKSIEGLNPVRHYNRLAELTKLTMFIAADDEVLGYSPFEGINDGVISLVEISANHDFTGESRNTIIEIIKSELGSKTSQ